MTIDLDYIIGYEILNQCSNEEDLLAGVIEDVVFTRLRRRDMWVDLGAGNGRLTLRLAAGFTRRIVVEPDPILYSMARYAVLSRFPGSVVLRDELPAVLERVRDGCDVILLSHVFYHLEKDDWQGLITRLFGKLTPGGALVIVLWNRQSEAYEIAVKYRKKKDLTVAETLTECLRSMAVKEPSWPSEILVRRIDPTIKLASPEALKMLISFLAKSSPDELHLDAINPDYVEEFAEASGVLIVNSQDVFVLFRE